MCSRRVSSPGGERAKGVTRVSRRTHVSPMSIHPGSLCEPGANGTTDGSFALCYMMPFLYANKTRMHLVREG